MNAFIRRATGSRLFMAAILLAASLSRAASQTPTSTCYDETKSDPCTAIAGVTTGKDFCGPMTFRDGGVVPGYGRVIYVIGTFMSPTSKSDTNILDNSAQGFEDFLKTASVPPGALVVLHSPGGAVNAGFAIGETIRKNSLRTMVGQPQAPDTSTPLKALATAAPGKGVCASSCSIAFLGGARRIVPNGSLYGVHAAEISNVPATATLGAIYYQGEVTAAQTSAYLEEMGIDAAWLYVADQCAAGANKILFLTAAQMTQLKATTAFTTQWTLLDDSGVIVVAGTNSDSSAIPGFSDDLILGCVGTPRRLVMRVDYLPEAYNHGEPAGAPRSSPTAFAPLVSGFSLSGFKTNTVANNQPMLINLTTTDALAPLSIEDQHHVTTTIAVTSPVADLLKASDTLQFSFKGQVSPVGQVNFDLTDGHQVINDYMAACH
jgi:hypothetical protein